MTSTDMITSLASMTSTASLASTASFNQNTCWAWCCHQLGNKMTYPGLSMWNGLSKIHNFMDFWHSFCWRLWRTGMLFSTKSKCHKSNVRISWMYRFCFYDFKVHFWWRNKCLKYNISSLNTLYTFCTWCTVIPGSRDFPTPIVWFAIFLTFLTIICVLNI